MIFNNETGNALTFLPNRVYRTNDIGIFAVPAYQNEDDINNSYYVMDCWLVDSTGQAIEGYETSPVPKHINDLELYENQSNQFCINQ